MESSFSDRPGGTIKPSATELTAGEAAVLDVDLVAAVQRGEGEAARVLVLRHLPRVRRLIGQLVLDPDAADDLTQDVFVSLWRGLDGFRGEAAFTTWLHRIAVNAAYRHLRETGRTNGRRSGESLENTLGLLANPAARPEALVIDAERWERVSMALEQLEPQIRTALVLTVLQGMSAGEVAEIEGCPVGTIYWRVHEARRRLRDDLKEWFE